MASAKEITIERSPDDMVFGVNSDTRAAKGAFNASMARYGAQGFRVRRARSANGVSEVTIDEPLEIVVDRKKLDREKLFAAALALGVIGFALYKLAKGIAS